MNKIEIKRQWLVVLNEHIEKRKLYKADINRAIINLRKSKWCYNAETKEINKIKKRLSRNE